jgi:multidrug efflux system outer membrane protein
MRIISVLIILLLQACANEKPINFSAQDQKVDQVWYSFADSNLNELIKEATKNNHDVLTAMININKAQAYFDVSKANRLPDVSLKGSVSKERGSDNMNTTMLHKPYNILSLSALINYQVDIWGKVAAASKAAKAQLLALNSTKKAVQITVISEVSKAYFNLIALNEKIRNIENSVRLSEKLYNLTAKQLKAGLVDDVEVQKAKYKLHLDQSQLLFLKQGLEAQEKSLSVILGRDVSTSTFAFKKNIESLAILKLPANIPSKLLLKRPDIEAAEQRLVAAKHQVHVARASYFPEISLNALFGFNSNHSGNLFDPASKSKHIGANFAMPVFDFGKTKANVQYMEADKSQAMLDYQHVVRVAFAEGLTSLSAQKNACDNFIQSKARENAAAKTYKIANKQLKNGAIDLLAAIEVEKNLFSTKMGTVDAAQHRLNSTVDLFKAFAGNLE